MKVCFVASGPESWASARIRCYWPAKYMSNAQVVQYGSQLPDADVYIWQKSVDTGEVDRRPSARHVWDMCDPLWWFNPQDAREVISRVDFTVCGNERLTADFENWCGTKAYTIPDRIDLNHYSRQRWHDDTQPVRFIWYGLSVNRVALAGAWANLTRLAANGYKIELTVMDDRPDVAIPYGQEIQVYYKPWQLQQENATIANHDIALLPPYPGPWGRIKSNNRTLTAWACGLPAVTGHEYSTMVKLVESANLRDMAGQAGRVHVVTEWQAHKSAAEWEALLCSS